MPVQKGCPGANTEGLPNGADKWSRREVGWLVFAALGLTLLITVLPQRAAGTDLDSSWKLVLTYAHEHGLMWGRELVFTFGPLGFLFTPVFTGIPFGMWLVALLAMNFVLAIGMCLWCRRLSWIWRLVFVWLLAAVFIAPDTRFESGLVCWGLLCLAGPEAQTKWSCALLGVVIAVLSLWKFNLLLVGGATAVCVAVCLAARARKAESLQVLCVPAVLFVAGWLALGERVSDLSVYFSRSLQLSQGYNLSMAVSPPGGILVIGLCVAVLLIVAVSLHTVVSREHEFPPSIRLIALLWILLMSFVAWKHGFTRAAHHEAAFFGFAALLVIVLQGLAVTPSTVLVLSRATTAAVVVLACVATEWESPGLLKARGMQACWRLPSNLSAIFYPQRDGEKYRAALEVEREAAKLPRTRAVVGRATVDVFGENQAFAVFNGLNYHPRPAFQSYTAFTPPLVRLNQQFYEGSSAPEFVLFNLSPLDGRVPALEDGGALCSLLTEYQPVEAEGLFLTFKRSNNPPARLSLVFEGSARFNELIELSRFGAGELCMEVTVRPTLPGVLRQVVYQPANVSLRTWTGSPLQPRIQFHAPAAMLESPFLIKPFLADTLDAVDLYTGQSSNEPAAVSIESASSDSRFYRQPFQFRIYELDRALKRPPDPSLLRLRWPGFRSFPCQWMTPLNPICLTTVDNESAIRVPPGGYLKFRVPPGATQVHGAYGFEESAYVQGTTDGAEFRVELEAEDGSTRLLQSELLQPRSKSADRGLHQFEIKLPAGSSGKIVLRTTPGPANEAAWDLTCWARIQID